MLLALSTFAAATSLSVVSAPVPQPRSTGLDDLVGARAGQAEGELTRRGYRNMRGEKGDDRSYTYWWNERRRQCVTIATMNGRYDSITPTTPPDCRRDARGDRRYRPATPPPRSGNVATGDLSRYCRGEAAAAFDRWPGDITTVGAIAVRGGGHTVRGWFDRDKRTTFFTCRFDADGRFRGVN